jgi:N-acetylglutamate synthase-like GNAT family acetyltransferase
MTPFTIRLYTPSDLESCRVLWAELTDHHRMLYGDPTIGGSEPGMYFDQYLHLPGLAKVWIAEREGLVVGLAGLLIYAEEGEIEPVVVKAGYRAKGIGRRLVAEGMEEAKRRNVRFLSVRPVARNQAAIDFFVGNGFGLVGQVELFQELSLPSERQWKTGLRLHGHELGF